MLAPAERHTAVGVEELVVARVPVGVGEHGAARRYGVEQRPDQRVRATLQPPDPADRRVGHDRVTRAEAQALQVGPQVGTGDEHGRQP